MKIKPYTVSDFNKDRKKIEDPIAFGFPSLGRLGIFKGTLSVVSAKTGEGKTSFMLNVLLNLLRDDEERQFVFWTYEEPSYLILAKLQLIAAAREQGVEEMDGFREFLSRLRRDRIPKTAKPAVERIEGYLSGRRPRLLLFGDHVDAQTLPSALKSLHKEHQGNLGAVFIDYVQQIPPAPRDGPGQAPGYREIKAAVGALRRFAVDTNVPVIVGAQVTSDNTSRKGANPSLNTRESRDIEMDAALWIHLEVPKRRRGETDRPDFDHRTVKVMKHRYGPTGEAVDLRFVGKHFLFQDVNQPTGTLAYTPLESGLYLHESMRGEAKDDDAQA